MTVFPRAAAGLTWAVLCLLPTLALAAPRFSVAGVNANNEVRLRTSTGHVETVLRVDLLTASAEAGGEAPADTRLTVLVDPLLSTDGTQVPVTVRVGTAADGAMEAPISVRQPVTVALTAELPSPGEYKGRVVLLGDGVREVATLVIQRVAVAPTVQFYPVSPARGWTLGPFSGKATVRLTFKETAGVGGEVGPAAVVQLDRKEGGAGNGAAPVQAQDAHWSFRGQAASGDDASAEGGAGKGGVFQVPANGTGLLSLDVDGLPESGEYTGTVRLLVPQGAPVEQTFTVWVKTPALWGAFLIFLGVVTSAAVRFYVQRVRPRVTLRGRAEAARHKLQELVPARPLEREAAVAASLRRQVDALLENIQRPLSGLVVQDSVLSLFEARLQLFSLWSVLLRQLEALKGMALLDAEKKLKAVETLLQNDQATSADFTEQAQYLRTLDLEGVARAVLASRLEELEQQSQTLVSQRGDDAVSRRLQGELPLYLLRARQQLPGTDLDTSRRLVDTAREAFLEILLSDLEGSLSGRELPGGFTPEEWAELRTRVAEQLARARARKSASVDEAFLYYQSAQALYLRALVDNLEEALTAAHAEVGGDMGALSEWESEVDERLKSARAHLDQGEANLATPDYRAARESFERHATLRQKAASIGGRQSVMEPYPDVTLDPFSQKPAEAPPPLPGAPAGGSITPLPPPGTTKTGTDALVNLDWIPLPRSSDLWKVELAVLGMMSIIAVLLGLQLLDVFSPTWGGSGAWMSAFLWGFGLHQVGNATFDGLWGMVSKLEK
ncbi:hypothetical protein [Corallococcus terminator]|uniref:Uncharacterized protein n=1 Tax=Corallococcus terminator TaxID=2316733 RepID=A0A3A8JAY0_9BACT|nr:hypothetical protein [Corallococcus terminator]RKG92842.1 hypothetical protein D7V88_04560 [Corallococcus terminator]